MGQDIRRQTSLQERSLHHGTRGSLGHAALSGRREKALSVPWGVREPWPQGRELKIPRGEQVAQPNPGAIQVGGRKAPCNIRTPL